MTERLKEIELFVLDMDGTVHLGGEIFPWSLPFFDKLRSLNKGYVFLTNNSSKAPWEYENLLIGMGIVEPKVFTSGEATAMYIKNSYNARKVYVFGTDSLKEIFKINGFVLDENEPEILVLGYDTTATYEKIAKFALLLRKKLPYIATHPDINCPSKDGLIPDAGSFIALFEKSTGRLPDVVIGKPNPEILFEISKKYYVSVEKIGVVGDRLYTDIEMALRSGALPILVLSGETKFEDIPDDLFDKILVVENLGELLKML